MDNQTTVQQLKDILKKFRDERDWEQFNDPKNLAEALSIEASELLETMLWKSKEEVIKKLEEDEVYKEEVADELADVVNYCLNFANATGIDISEAVKNKIVKANKRYPIGKSKGTATKWDKL